MIVFGKEGMIGGEGWYTPESLSWSGGKRSEFIA